jgi:hypothetical protein
MEPDVLMQLAHSPVRNYAVPGLTSWLIGKPESGGGCVRLFVSEREQQRDVTPHSHRFNFECLVLTGTVRNRIWQPSESGDLFFNLRQENGRLGGYEISQQFQPVRYDFRDEFHHAGQWYGMDHDAIHSIFFSRGAKVLFFEGPEVTSETRILEPCVDGCRIPTLATEPWMFKS